MVSRKQKPAKAAVQVPVEVPPGRCVVVANKCYQLDEVNGERRALAAMRTHHVLATPVLVDGRRSTEQLRGDRNDPPPRWLALIGTRVGEREVVAIKRGPATAQIPVGPWVAVLRCPAGHLRNMLPGMLGAISGCGACQSERLREINRARYAAKK